MKRVLGGIFGLFVVVGLLVYIAFAQEELTPEQRESVTRAEAALNKMNSQSCKRQPVECMQLLHKAERIGRGIHKDLDTKLNMHRAIYVPEAQAAYRKNLDENDPGTFVRGDGKTIKIHFHRQMPPAAYQVFWRGSKEVLVDYMEYENVYIQGRRFY